MKTATAGRAPGHTTRGLPPSRARSPRPGAGSASGFVLRFLGGSLAGLAALAWIPAITSSAIAATTTHAALLAHRLGVPLEPRGDQLVWGGLHLEIVPECTPLVPMVLLASAIAAYPAPVRRRALGILAAAPVLWIYNLARVLVLALVMARRPAWFEFIHVYLWQAVTLAVCAGIFALWLRHGVAPLRVRSPRSDRP